MAERYHLKIDI